MSVNCAHCPKLMSKNNVEDCICVPVLPPATNKPLRSPWSQNASFKNIAIRNIYLTKEGTRVFISASTRNIRQPVPDPSQQGKLPGLHSIGFPSLSSSYDDGVSVCEGGTGVLQARCFPIKHSCSSLVEIFHCSAPWSSNHNHPWPIGNHYVVDSVY